MTYIDILLIIPLVYGLLRGISKGLIKEMAALIAVIVGIYFCRYFSITFTETLSDITGWEWSICMCISYVLIFLLTVISIVFVAKIISEFLEIILLDEVNRLFGAAFGFLKMLLLLSVILNFLSVINESLPFKDSKEIKESTLYVPIEKSMGYILPFLRYENFREAVQTGIIDPVNDTIDDVK